MKGFIIRVLVGIPIYVIGAFLNEWWTGSLYLAGIISVLVWDSIPKTP